MPNDDLRSNVFARPIDPATGRPDGNTFQAIALKKMFVPTMVPGTAPYIASGQVLCVLADLRPLTHG